MARPRIFANFGDISAFGSANLMQEFWYNQCDKERK